jgi:exodeoxyribonuclease VII large subunit
VSPRRGGRAVERDPALPLFGDEATLAPPPPARVRPERTPDPGTTPETAVSIGTLAHTIRDVLEGAFTPLWVRGEISNFTQHRNGHWYFTLKDAACQLRCVMWATARRRVPAAPDEGMEIVALGQVTSYPARGDLQFSVTALDAVGDGLWRKAFEQVRARLEADGLLSPSRKRAICPFPTRVAVITSADGAALHDIVSVARRRAPGVELVLVPAAVQGDGAPDSLCAALALVARWGAGECQTLIIGRGGGSREDLWAFNDERVARAVAACPVPVISAVGHEVDVTICDLVADLRAATPSAAAEAAVPVWAELRDHLARLATSMRDCASDRVRAARDDAGRAARHLETAAGHLVEARRLRLGGLAGRLDALSPLGTLRRGYAVARTPGGATLRSVHAVAAGDPLDVLLADGSVRTRVESVHATAQEPAPADAGGDPA